MRTKSVLDANTISPESRSFPSPHSPEALQHLHEIGALLLALVLQTYITRSRGIYIRWKTITHVKRVEDLVDSPCSRVEILRAAWNINGNGLPEGSPMEKANFAMLVVVVKCPANDIPASSYAVPVNAPWMPNTQALNFR